MRFDRTDALILVTAPGLPLVAVLIDTLTDRVNLAEALGGGISWPIQFIGSFLVVPFLALLAFRAMEQNRFFKPLSEFNHQIFQSMKPTMFRIIMLSIAAGFGEELLFRGAIQPLAGIVPASLLFGALHTGFRLTERVYLLYGCLVFIISVILGVVADTIGLLAAMTAHGVWDFTILYKLYSNKSCDYEPDHYSDF